MKDPECHQGNYMETWPLPTTHTAQMLSSSRSEIRGFNCQLKSYYGNKSKCFNSALASVTSLGSLTPMIFQVSYEVSLWFHPLFPNWKWLYLFLRGFWMCVSANLCRLHEVRCFAFQRFFPCFLLHHSWTVFFNNTKYTQAWTQGEEAGAGCCWDF